VEVVAQIHQQGEAELEVRLQLVRWEVLRLVLKLVLVFLAGSPLIPDQWLCAMILHQQAAV